MRCQVGVVLRRARYGNEKQFDPCAVHYLVGKSTLAVIRSDRRLQYIHHLYSRDEPRPLDWSNMHDADFCNSNAAWRPKGAVTGQASLYERDDDCLGAYCKYFYSRLSPGFCRIPALQRLTQGPLIMPSNRPHGDDSETGGQKLECALMVSIAGWTITPSSCEQLQMSLLRVITYVDRM